MRDESRSQMRNWVPERMALKTHPKGSKGVYKDNLSWVAGVKVEIKKKKDMRVNLVAGVKEEIKKKNIFFVLKIYEGELDSKAIRQPFPGNGARNACWYFLTFTE